MDYFAYFAIVLAFLAVFLLVEGLALSWSSVFASERKHLRPRLQAIGALGVTPGSPTLIKLRALARSPWLQDLLERFPRVASLDDLILQAGYELKLSHFLALSFGMAVISAAALELLKFPTLVVILGSLGGLIAPTLYLHHAKRQRLARIEQQLPSALDLISRAMRAGHAFPSALKMAGEELPAPIARDFEMVFEEISFGLDSQTALDKFAVRVPLPDVRHFVLAVSIQRATGGNLSVLLLNIAGLMRDRAKFKRSIRTLTAEGRLSAWILVILPFALGAVLHFINPGFIDVLFTDPIGLKLVWTALALMVLGIFWMSRIVNIRT